MEAINHINLQSLLDTFVSLTTAFVLGSIIGIERQYRQRTAGLRTNALVAVGAAIFVDMANRLNGPEATVHVVAYVVSGIGFLGAGVIMRENGNVRGLNTAATIWGSAAVGACAGADLILEAILASIFVLISNTLLRPIVDSINRKPLNVRTAEVTNTFYVIAMRERQKEALALVERVLENANYQVNNLEVHAFGSNEVEIEARLLATSIDGEELDRLIQDLLTQSFISQAFWSSSTSD